MIFGGYHKVTFSLILKVQEGSLRFMKVQEGSRRFKETQKGSRKAKKKTK